MMNSRLFLSVPFMAGDEFVDSASDEVETSMGSFIAE